MTPKRKPANPAASVRARLLNLARSRGHEFQVVLAEYAIERLLYRLGVSPYADRFVLKGATLFRLWTGDSRRATWDLDLHGKQAASIEATAAIARELCRIPGEDGIHFDPESIRAEAIRSGDSHPGVRIHMEALLADATIPVQVDVGFGPSVTPPPRQETYPTLLDHEAPSVLANQREVVVAEKLEALVALGVTNSRMKDFYDLYVLASTFAFSGQVLKSAVRSTFEQRGTPFPDGVPVSLQDEFLAAGERRTLWRAFLRRSRLNEPQDAGSLVEALRRFVIPVLEAVRRGETYDAIWDPGGPWRQEM